MKTTKQDLEAERFIHRAMKYLTASFPEQAAAMDAETLKNKVIDDCEYALSYGYETTLWDWLIFCGVCRRISKKTRSTDGWKKFYPTRIRMRN